MPQINFSDSIYTSNAFIKLMQRGHTKREATGMLCEAIFLAINYSLSKETNFLIPLEVWKREGMAHELIEVGLATVRDGYVFVVGTEKQTSMMQARQKGGLSKAAKRAIILPKEVPAEPVVNLAPPVVEQAAPQPKPVVVTEAAPVIPEPKAKKKREPKKVYTISDYPDEYWGLRELFVSREVNPLLTKKWLDKYSPIEWICEQVSSAENWELAKGVPKINFGMFVNGWLARAEKPGARPNPILITEFVKEY